MQHFCLTGNPRVFTGSFSERKFSNDYKMNLGLLETSKGTCPLKFLISIMYYISVFGFGLVAMYCQIRWIKPLKWHLVDMIEFIYAAKPLLETVFNH